MAKKKKYDDLFSVRHNYCKTVAGIMDAADAVAAVKTLQWFGMVRLGCALQGMELIPYNNIDYMERAAYWTSVTLEDDETYFIVPFNIYKGEHDGGSA